MAIAGSSAKAQALVDSAPRFGSAHLDRFAKRFVRIDDLNGDGIDDVLVSAPGDDTAGTDAGSVVVLSGADLDVELIRIDGVPSEEWGEALCAIADVDADGLADFVVGVPEHNGAGGIDQGLVVLVSSATATILATFTVDEKGIRLGQSIANVGDRDGDGLDDLLVGAPKADALISDGGAAFLLSVTASGFTSLHRFDGDGSTELLGTDLCSLADVDLDGKDELVIGSPGWFSGGPARGRVQIFSGDPGSSYVLLRTFTGQQAFEFFGESLAAIEDPDGSGHPAVLIGFHGRSNFFGDPSAGGVGIYDAVDGTTIREYEGDHSFMCLGTAVAAVDDQDGDGFQDVLAGAPFDAWGGGVNQGSVELLSTKGVAGGPLERLYRLAGDAGLDRLGYEVGMVGDLDGDGCKELAFSADAQTPPSSGDQTGALHVVRARTPRLRSSSADYTPGDVLQLNGLTYANRNNFMVLGLVPSTHPYFQIDLTAPAWIFLLTSDTFGQQTLDLRFPGFQGGTYPIYFQSYTLHRDAAKFDRFLFSELITVTVH